MSLHRSAVGWSVVCYNRGIFWSYTLAFLLFDFMLNVCFKRPRMLELSCIYGTFGPYQLL